MDYKPQPYPKFKYHANEPARIVHNYEEEEALGDDWADRPDLVRPPATQLELEAAPSDEEIKQDLAESAFDPPPKRKRK